MNCRAGKCSATVAVLLGALVCIVFVEGLSFAATPRSGRFLDRLLRSTEVSPQLISVPVPRPATASEQRISQQQKRPSVPAEEEKQPAVLANIYSWESFIRFAEGFQDVGEHVVRVAVDPSYIPDDKPKFQPIFDASELSVIEEQRNMSSAGSGSGKTQAPVRATSMSSNPYVSKKSIGAMPPKSPRLQRLRVRIAQTLATYQRRPMNTSHHSPWEIMHGFVGFG
ncbi:MAG: hypothetical protein HOH16_03365, partial [Planctomycetaceae bacterium]|nr:hypothetical protein [Planctomycetaceae bacterium]